MFETRNKVLGGSRTADNLADIESAQGITGNGAQALIDLMNLRLGSATVNAGRAVAPYATGQNEATRELAARALLSRDPQSVLGPALQQALKGNQRQRIIEAITRSGGIRLGQGN